jgi:hypothetical protein
MQRMVSGNSGRETSSCFSSESESSSKDEDDDNDFFNSIERIERDGVHDILME